MPGSIAHRIGSACTIVRDWALVPYGYLADWFAASILLQTPDDGWIGGIGHAGTEVKDQCKAAILCLGGGCDPK